MILESSSETTGFFPEVSEDFDPDLFLMYFSISFFVTFPVSHGISSSVIPHSAAYSSAILVANFLPTDVSSFVVADFVISRSEFYEQNRR